MNKDFQLESSANQIKIIRRNINFKWVLLLSLTFQNFAFSINVTECLNRCNELLGEADRISMLKMGSKCTEEFPKNGDVRLCLAIGLFINNKLQQGIKEVETAQKLGLQQKNQLIPCYLFVQFELWSDVITACTSYLKTEPKNGAAYFYLALAYENDGRMNTALKFYQNSANFDASYLNSAGDFCKRQLEKNYKIDGCENYLK